MELHFARNGSKSYGEHLGRLGRPGAPFAEQLGRGGPGGEEKGGSGSWAQGLLKRVGQRGCRGCARADTDGTAWTGRARGPGLTAVKDAFGAAERDATGKVSMARAARGGRVAHVFAAVGVHPWRRGQGRRLLGLGIRRLRWLSSRNTAWSLEHRF